MWEVEGAETSDRSEVDHGIKLQITDTLKVTRELRLYLIDNKGTASYLMLQEVTSRVTRKVTEKMRR